MIEQTTETLEQTKSLSEEWFSEEAEVISNIHGGAATFAYGSKNFTKLVQFLERVKPTFESLMSIMYKSPAREEDESYSEYKMRQKLQACLVKNRNFVKGFIFRQALMDSVMKRAETEAQKIREEESVIEKPESLIITPNDISTDDMLNAQNKLIL